MKRDAGRLRPAPAGRPAGQRAAASMTRAHEAAAAAGCWLSLQPRPPLAVCSGKGRLSAARGRRLS